MFENACPQDCLQIVPHILRQVIFRTQAKRGMESKGREIMEEFGIKTSIYFGKNALEYLKKLQGAGIFIVTDPFMVESGLVERITGYLEKDRCTIFSNVVPDPPWNW